MSLGPWTGGTTENFRFRKGDRIVVLGERLKIVGLVTSNSVSSAEGYRVLPLRRIIKGEFEIWGREKIDSQGVLLRTMEGRDLGL